VHRRAAILLVIATALAGCGSGDDPVPDDFELSFRHAAGSVPPPFHDEWRLDAGLDGKGSLTYHPDYPSRDPPVFRESFSVPREQVAALYERVRDAGDGGDEGVGGDTNEATVTADGDRTEVAALEEALVADIHDLAPASVWSDIERRRDEYARQRYGRAP